MSLEYVSAKDLLGLEWNLTKRQVQELVENGVQPYDEGGKPIVVLSGTVSKIQGPKYSVLTSFPDRLTPEQSHEIYGEGRRTIIIYKGDHGVAPSQEECLISQILDEVRFKIEDVEKYISNRAFKDELSLDNQPRKERIGFNTGQPSHAAIKRAKELKSIVEKLYKLTMKEHWPIKVNTAEDCLKTALAILDDNPDGYFPIAKSDLTSDLFNMDPSHCRRDFVSRLLQLLLEKEDLSVSNLERLYDEISKKNNT